MTLDDLHHADPDSLRLTRFLAAELRAARVLLVATYRDVEVRRGHPLGALLAELAREPGCERVTLRGLPAEAVADLVADVARAPASDAWTRAVLDMTEGNPFFVREVARLLADEGRLAAEPAPGVALALPQGVRDVVGRRLDALSPACNDLLRAASVLGREVDARILERVLDLRGEPAPRAPRRGRRRPRPRPLARSRRPLRLLPRTPVSDPLRGAPRTRAASPSTPAPPTRSRPPSPSAPTRRSPSSPTTPSSPSPRAAPSPPSAGPCAPPSAPAASTPTRRAPATPRAPSRRSTSPSARDDARRCELLASLGEALGLAGQREAGRAWLLRAADLARRLGRADLLARAAVGYRGFGEMGNPADATTLALLEEARAAVRPRARRRARPRARAA